MTRHTKESLPEVTASVKTTPVAIIGMGSIFPQAHNTQEYWDNILRKIDCITDVPPSRWNVEDYYDPDPSVPDKTYCKRGGFIPDIDFDPMEFGLPPNILEVTDVSQLLALVVARDALADAGYAEDRQFDREHTGCVLGYVGTSSKIFTPLMTRLQYPVWEKVLRSAGLSEADTHTIVEKIKLAYVGWEENSFPGAIGNVVAGRVCNRFDLGGMNCVVDAACASSLAAIKVAVGELVNGRANMMITGGVDTDNSINSYMCFSKTPAFTRKENVRTFDAESAGMMLGEGLGMIILKRLEDAERDGDRVYAVIHAVGASSDGRFKSIYAPRPAGQAVALRRAYEEAGFPMETVGLIEAHGTGTAAGDPAEFQGLCEAFDCGESSRKQYIALGSVKSQIAHTAAAAGVASMIKVALALYHKVLPATINVTRPNPRFKVESTPFYINSETRPWIRAQGGTPRRAGVSSFGFGGTNYHVVLQEHEAEHGGAYRLNSVAEPVILAAPDPAALLAAARDALQSLQGAAAGTSFYHLVQKSRALGIPASHARIGFVAETAQEACQLLQTCIEGLSSKPQEDSWDHPRGIFYRKSGMDTRGKVVALFSGQGSQYLEMGRELAINFPVVRDVFATMDALFLEDGLEPLSARVYPRPVFETQVRDALSEALTRTEHAQPAIGSISVGLYKLLQQAGFQPDFVAGHSFGELTALWAAGVLSDRDYYSLAKARGKAMAPPENTSFDAGTMVAVKGEAEKVRAALQGDPEVTLANWNSNDQVVIAGSKPAMARAQKMLGELGFKTIPLAVSAAFHTALVGHAQKPFAQAIHSVRFNRPGVKVYSNSTARPHSDDPKEIQARLAAHILNPVLFRDEIQNIFAAGGTIFIEFGPKNVLTNLVDNILAGKPHLAVALNANARKDGDRQLREAVVALRVAGLPLKDFDPYEARPVVSAPRKKSPVTVQLNGGYYVSEKTRSAFEKALKDGFRASLPTAAQPQVTPVEDLVKSPPAPPPAPERKNGQERHGVVEAGQSTGIEQALAGLEAHETETLRLHEQYLRMEEEYARAFIQMTRLQSDLVARAAGGAPGEMQAILPLFESLERSMARFHEHQAETLRVHQHYLETQERFSQSLAQGVVAAPLPAAAAPGVKTPSSLHEVRASTLPVPAAPQRLEAPPSISKNTNGNSARPAPAPAVLPQAPVVTPAPSASRPDAGRLKEALLQIVSEKTGYPVETLELDMDMEADLGIDSIKRVEILGGMQAQFPELPRVETNVLAELRTLGQIVDQLSAAAPAESRPAEGGLSGGKEISTAAPLSPQVQAAPGVPSFDPQALTPALLSIVSEKTGYPVETLELDMDMEADLGIDSIKRVEILGVMQSQFPELPKVEASTLAELRTLGQIVQVMSSSLPSAAPGEPEKITTPEPAADNTAPAAPAVSLSGVDAGVISAALLQVVSEKTGYPVETLEMDMDMEADLGIDSIKRVEILGAIQAQFPELPKVDAAALAELRTLGQITQYLSSAGHAAAPSQEVAAQSPFEPVGEAEDTLFDSGIEQGVVIRKVLPPPDSIDFSLPEGHICLLTDDGTGVTPALAQALLDSSWPVVVLRLPEALLPAREPLPPGAASLVLADLSEAALQSSLDQISKQYGPTAAFIFLSPVVKTSAEGVSFPEAEKSLLKLAFLAAKHLKADLNQAAENSRGIFMTVTRLDGVFGLGDEPDYTPISGGVFGLVKTLNLEWEAVFCRALDLSPALDPGRAVGCILAELHDPNRLVTEVGYTPGERSTLALASVPMTGGRK